MRTKNSTKYYVILKIILPHDYVFCPNSTSGKDKEIEENVSRAFIGYISDVYIIDTII